MKELIDVVTIYLALAVGFASLWWGIFRGWGIEASLTRALVGGIIAVALGAAAKFLWVLASFSGGRRRRPEVKEREESTPGEGESR